MSKVICFELNKDRRSFLALIRNGEFHRISSDELTLLEKEIRDSFLRLICYKNKLKDQTYHIGQTIRMLDCDFVSKLYILAQVGSFEVTAIALSSGNRWANPIEVSDTSKITESEMSIICSDSRFEVVENE